MVVILKVTRNKLQLENSISNDALVISGIKKEFVDNINLFYIKQFRKKKRSLHEATARKVEKNPTEKLKEIVKIRLIAMDFILMIKSSI